jgi:hypothetical protein
MRNPSKEQVITFDLNNGFRIHLRVIVMDLINEDEQKWSKNYLACEVKVSEKIPLLSIQNEK